MYILWIFALRISVEKLSEIVNALGTASAHSQMHCMAAIQLAVKGF
jgi:hypothetical protein